MSRNLPALILFILAQLAAFELTAACGPIPTDYVAYGGNELEIKRGVTLNNTPVSESKRYKALLPDASLSNPSPAPSLPGLDPASFPRFGGGSDIEVEKNRSASYPAGTYDEVKVKERGSLNFTTVDGDYYIDKLDADKNSRITLAPGNYYIEELKLDDGAELVISPDGTVRIYIKKEFEAKKNTRVNYGGSPANLQIFAYDDAKIEFGDNSRGAALIYSPYRDSEIELKKNSRFNGMLVTNGEVKLEENVRLTLSADDLNDASSWSSCQSSGPLTPVAAWYFDEASFAGGQVLDSGANGFHGSAQRGVATESSTPAIPGSPGTCGYSRFDGIDDYISIPHDPLLNGSDSLTYLIWVNPETWSGVRQVLAKSVHGGGSGRAQMGIFSEGGRLKGRAETRRGRQEITASLPILNRWSHLALVFDGASLELYVNGVSVASRNFRSTTLRATPDPLEIGRRTLSDRYFFLGAMDEARVYKEALTDAQVAAVMNETRPCDITSGSDAFGFNCIAAGQDGISGRLNTRLAGQAFNFDLVALKDADTDGIADSIETDYAADADRSVTLEIVDTSDPARACSGANPYPSVSSQTLTFTAAAAGRINSGDLTVANAYRSLGCRVTDSGGAGILVGCSTDSFALRPSAMTVSAPLLTNGGATGTPLAKAGAPFSLQVTAQVGYDGTPVIDNSKLQAHAGALQTGTLTGSFGAADPASGNATGNGFVYSEVGNFRFQPQGVYDSGFTAVDQPGDCNADFSNTLDANGKLGCWFGDPMVSGWVGRFTPDHFTLTVDAHGTLQNSCTAGGFSYSGQAVGYAVGGEPAVTITAWNGLATATVTRNYSGDYDKLSLAGITIPDITSDWSQLGVDGVNKVGLGWTLGGAALNNNGDGTIGFALSGDQFTYTRGANDQVAPFTSDVRLRITGVTDGDGVAATGLPLEIRPAGVQVRYGRLLLSNAHGSELQHLNVPLRVEYYDGSGNGFVTNLDDSCTTGVTVSLSDLDAGDDLVVSTGADRETAVFADASVAGGYAADDLSNPALLFVQPAVGGDFNLNLQAPGENNTGSAGVTVDAPAWLEYDWSGGGMADPLSKATFGIYSRPGSLIYLRERR